MNLFQKYYKIFTSYGEKIAIGEEKRKFSYYDLLRMATGGRELIADCNPAPNEPIAIVCHNRAESYAAIFSCWFSGHPIVPLHPGSPFAWNHSIINDLNISLLFDCLHSEPGSYPEGVRLLDNSTCLTDANTPPVHLEPDNLVYILTTSGSTGIPKRVPVSLQNLTAFTEGFLELFPGMGSEDRFLQTYDLTADAAFTAFLIPLILGGTLELVPDHPFKYLAVAKALQTRNVSWAQVTPSLLLCLKPYFSQLSLGHLRWFHWGGETLPASLVEEFRPSIPNAEIANVYGPTETTITTLMYKCKPNETLRQYKGSVSIGKPLPDCILSVIDDEGRVVAGEGEGELFIGGPQVMEGYWKEKTPEAFRMVPHEGQMKKFYRTGDKVRRDENGYFYFLGRLNAQVKISGFRIDLQEVEHNCKLLWPESEFVAIAPEVSPGHKKLIVYAVGFVVPEADAIAQANLNYPEHLVPERILPLTSIPLNPSGKSDRNKLEMLYLTLMKDER